MSGFIHADDKGGRQNEGRTENMEQGTMEVKSTALIFNIIIICSALYCLIGYLDVSISLSDFISGIFLMALPAAIMHGIFKCTIQGFLAGFLSVVWIVSILCYFFGIPFRIDNLKEASTILFNIYLSSGFLLLILNINNRGFEWITLYNICMMALITSFAFLADRNVVTLPENLRYYVPFILLSGNLPYFVAYITRMLKSCPGWFFTKGQRH